MAFADDLRSTTFTGGDIADLIEGIGSNSHPFTITTYSPTWAGSGGMTYTSVATDIAEYVVLGKFCVVWLNATGTLGGSGAAYVTATLPFSSKSYAASTVVGITTTNDGPSIGYARIVSGVTTTVRIYKDEGNSFSTGASKQVTAVFAYITA